MLDGFRLHLTTHLRFLARSRLLLGLAIVLGALWSLGLAGFLMMDSSGDRFDMLKTISGQLRSFAWFYTAGIGLFALWWHTHNRTTSLVFTRPGAPEIWLASIFGSAILLAVVIQTMGFLLTVVLCVVWNVPFQMGFVWLSLDAVLESVIMVSVLTGLGATVHPVLAIVITAFFTESMFYWFDVMLLAHLRGRDAAWWTAPLESFVRAVHTAAPMLDPFSEKTAQVESTLRVAGADWLYLAGTAGYAATVLVFWFAFADYRVRRQL